MKRQVYPVLIAVAVIFSATSTAKAQDQYSAIAYSQSTAKIGWSYGYTSLQQAKNRALENCNASDARVVTWARNAYCALALGDKKGAYGYGWGSSRSEAEAFALQNCRERTTNCYIAKWVFSETENIRHILPEFPRIR